MNFLFLLSAVVTVEQPKIEEQSAPPAISTIPSVSAAISTPESNDEYEKMVQNVMDMGYERTQVTN